MSTTGSETLNRIQQEIQENLRREEELRKKYETNTEITRNHNDNKMVNGCEPHRSKSPAGSDITGNSTAPTKWVKTNGFRRFPPNLSARGVMQKFLKMHGKININHTNNTSNSNGLIDEPNGAPDFTPTFLPPIDSFEPAKVALESDKPLRNGFISAEEKMRRELLDFQQREAALRMERRKSQPDLMAAIEAETEIETNLKPARSMAQLYSNEDLTQETHSAPASLKPAKSLAELCGAFDDDLEMPGTHSLIMQFENLKQDRD